MLLYSIRTAPYLAAAAEPLPLQLTTMAVARVQGFSKFQCRQYRPMMLDSSVDIIGGFLICITSRLTDMIDLMAAWLAFYSFTVLFTSVSFSHV